jgi:hypothetical protein
LLFQLAVRFGFFVVLLEKSWVSVRTIIWSKGMRVSSKENSSGRGYALIICPLYPGPQPAARWSVAVGPVYIMFVRVIFPFVFVDELKSWLLVFV